MANVPGLDAWIATDGGAAFVWGATDCCLFVADWVAARSGRDPAAAWRGSYRSLRQAHRLLKRRGGIVAAVSLEMDRLGFERTSDPLPGDVAIVTVPSGFRSGRIHYSDVAAIRVGRLWAVKGHRGMAGGDFPVRVAWALNLEDDPHDAR